MSHIRIIIPFYQSEATLERALLSIQKQTERNFECFLVNNHSTDGFQRVITPFLKDSRFSLVHEKKQGVSYAFNRGLEGATCPYIARMDADDEVLPERLEKQKEYLEQHQDIDMVGSQARHVPGSFFSEGLKRFVEWNNQILSPEDIQQHQFIETPVINPTAMFRRNSLEKFGSYIHGDFPEDYELWLRWLSKGARLAKLDDVLLNWYDSPARLTRKDERYRVEAFFNIKSYYLAMHLKKVNPYFLDVVVWGAGRKTRQRMKILTDKGLNIIYYVDIQADKTTAAPCYHYSSLPDPGRVFVLVAVTIPDARSMIENYLNERGYRVNQDYLMIG